MTSAENDAMPHEVPEHLRTSRYGERRGGRLTTRHVIVLVSAIGAVVLGMIAWGMFQPKATYTDLGYAIAEDGRSATVRFEVIKPPESTAICEIQALNTGFAQVGLREVTVGPHHENRVRLSEEIATSELATTAVVKSCRLV